MGQAVASSWGLTGQKASNIGTTPDVELAMTVLTVHFSEWIVGIFEFLEGADVHLASALVDAPSDGVAIGISACGYTVAVPKQRE
jgi:hypothetical protein